MKDQTLIKNFKSIAHHSAVTRFVTLITLIISLIALGLSIWSLVK